MARGTTDPLIVKGKGGIRRLERLPRSHSEFDESYLQELLVDHPELLPVHKLREDAGGLYCIGGEVSAGASGFIDNQYLSTGG